MDVSRCSTVALWSVAGNYLPTVNLRITLSQQASCQTPAEQGTTLHCLWDSQVFASYLEWTRIPRRRSSLLSTCAFIPKNPSDMQVNGTVILVDHMLVSQMFTENINSVSVVYICTIRKKSSLKEFKLVSTESSYKTYSRILGIQMCFPPLHRMPKIPLGYSRSLEGISSISGFPSMEPAGLL